MLDAEPDPEWRDVVRSLLGTDQQRLVIIEELLHCSYQKLDTVRKLLDPNVDSRLLDFAKDVIRLSQSNPSDIVALVQTMLSYTAPTCAFHATVAPQHETAQ